MIAEYKSQAFEPEREVTHNTHKNSAACRYIRSLLKGGHFLMCTNLYEGKKRVFFQEFFTQRVLSFILANILSASPSYPSIT